MGNSVPRWLRIVGLVLGSAWFLPAGCMGSLAAGTNLVAKLDERVAAEGDALHAHFRVAVQRAKPGPGEERVYFVGLETVRQIEPDLEEYGAFAVRPFLLPAPEGRVDEADSIFRYRVLEDRGEEQLIEVVEATRDGDRTTWSRYRATASGITPVSSRMMYFGYMYAAFPWALGFAFALYGAGRLIRKKSAA